jgi:hypothetical protein
MKHIGQFSILMLLVVFIAAPAPGQDLFVYPEKGQSEKQIEKDKFDCYTWAKKQTGFDPMEAPKATSPPPAQETPQGGVVRGAARGAVVGVVGGAIAGDAGKGAAIGAAAGGLIGGLRRRDQVVRQEHEEQQWAQQQAASYNQKRNSYNRAYAACLEGKGYTVK